MEPGKHVQEPGCRTSLTLCPPEKQRAPVDGASVEQEEVIGSLLDMGFSGVHARELLSIQPGTHPRQLLDIVSELILLGVNPEPAYVALRKSPQLLKLPVGHVRKRAGYLRRLGLGEGARLGPCGEARLGLGTEGPGEGQSAKGCVSAFRLRQRGELHCRGGA